MPINDKQKPCHRCNTDKPIGDFTKDKRCNGGRQFICRECKSLRSKELYQANAEKRAKHIKNSINARMKKCYGISLKEYENMFEAQGGKCALCGGVQIGNTRVRLDIDHDHDTGKVRGLLCRQCNLTVGQVEKCDLNAILGYIERYKVCRMINKNTS